MRRRRIADRLKGLAVFILKRKYPELAIKNTNQSSFNLISKLFKIP